MCSLTEYSPSPGLGLLGRNLERASPFPVNQAAPSWLQSYVLAVNCPHNTNKYPAGQNKILCIKFTWFLSSRNPPNRPPGFLISMVPWALLPEVNKAAANSHVTESSCLKAEPLSVRGAWAWKPGISVSHSVLGDATVVDCLWFQKLPLTRSNWEEKKAR